MASARTAQNDVASYLPRLAVEWDSTWPDALWHTLDASLCFVDISGFTALSERLASKGRVGAEELTEILNAVFSRMLHIAYMKGGSLLKFGGDALLLLFDGPEHEVRAVQAAVSMRAALREARQVPVSAAGRINLRMSVGIHSGEVHLFRVGASHRELLLSGPAASETVAMEQVAEAGEIVVSRATASALPPMLVGAAKGSGFLLRARTVVEGGSGPAPVQPQPLSLVMAGLPVALRDYLTAGSVQAEHRLATVAFIKYQGVDARLASHGPDDTAMALESLVSAVQAAVDAEGVCFLASDLDKDGGKIILVTGVPRTQDDDEGRMLRALRRIADAPVPMPLRIGVNRGYVFSGTIGTPFRRTYTIIGDTVNLAARLMAAAPDGAIYATSGVLDRSRVLYSTETIPPFPVKGKTALVQAFAVGQQSGVRAELRSSSPFVARGAELDRLEGAWSSAVRGQGRIVVIEAERGLGKSRLVDEFRSRRPAITTVVLQGEPFGAGSPYLPFRRALRELFGVTSDDRLLAAKELEGAVRAIDAAAVPLLPLLAPLVGVDLAETEETAAIAAEFRRDRAVDLIVRIWDASDLGPLLVVAEDTHWFDDAAARFLESLAQAARTRSWLIVATRRRAEDGVRLGSDDLIELAPLDSGARRELLDAATAAAPLRPSENDAILDRSGGNPLFVEELVRVARHRGAESLPESLDAVANAELDALAPLERQVLVHASVLGNSFGLELLSELFTTEEVDFGDSGWRQLTDYLVPDGPGRLRFRHALLREAAYESLPFRRRRELHRRAGEVITRVMGDEAEEWSDALSLHFFHAQSWAQTWTYARLAGARAVHAYAPSETAVHLERALAAASHLAGVVPSDVAAVWRDLGDARIAIGQYEQAEDAFVRGAGLANPYGLEWASFIERQVFVVGEHQGRHRAAVRLVHRALNRLEDAEAGDVEKARVCLLAREAEVRARQGRYKDALRIASPLIDRAKACDELRALAIAYNITDEALTRLGRSGEANHLESALHVYMKLGDEQRIGVVLGNLGAAAYFNGQWDEAADFYQRAAEVLLRAGDVASAAVFDANIGELRANQGRLEEARLALNSARRSFESLGLAAHELFTLDQLGRIAAQRGDDTEAMTLLQKAATLDQASGGPLAGVESRLFLAEAHVVAGRPAEALELLASIQTQAGSGLEGTPLGSLLDRVEAMAMLATGDTADLADRIDAAVPRAQGSGSYYDALGLMVLRSLLPDPPAEMMRELDRLVDQLCIVALPLL